MGNDVFANGREVSCKAADGKSICAFPDVCFTPPQTPATPPGVPIPYPNTGMASDTTDGSKTVKVSGKEVMLKNKSYFKKSMGDEAGCAPKKGLITSTNRGKVYFNSWSMDVKFEGENIVRHFDLTTHNHASAPGQTPPWPYIDSMAIDDFGNTDDPCAKEKRKENDKCTGKNKDEACADNACQQARKCMLRPYQPDRCCKDPKPGQTGHHLIEVHGFCKPGKPRGRPLPQFDGSNGKKPYDQNKAPVVCASCPRGSRFYLEHGDLHAVQGIKENAAIALAKQSGGDPTKAWTYSEAKQAGVDAHSATFKDAGCSDLCIEAQLDNYHKKEVGVKDSDPMRTDQVKFKKNDPDQQARGESLIKKLSEKRGNTANTTKFGKKGG